MKSNSKLWLVDSATSQVKLDFIRKYTLGKKVLDIGSAQGEYSKFLKGLNYEVTATDIENDMKFDDIKFVKADVEKLPFKKNEFDTSLVFDVIEHVENDSKALNELFRVTSKRVLLSVPNIDDTVLRPYNLAYKHHIDKSHYREYSVSGLKKLLEKHKFKVIYIGLQSPIKPGVISEFIGPLFLKFVVRKAVGLLAKLKILKNDLIQADIFVVADKKGR